MNKEKTYRRKCPCGCGNYLFVNKSQYFNGIVIGIDNNPDKSEKHLENVKGFLINRKVLEWINEVFEKETKFKYRRTPIIDIDKQNRSIFLIFEKGKTKESDELKIKDKTFIFDFDENGRVVGIEILY